jgi:hypothetical protein
MSRSSIALGTAQLTVLANRRPSTISSPSFPGDGPYAIEVWLGILGPTATLLYARLCRVLATADAAIVEITELASALGIGEMALRRSIQRLIEFRLLEWDGAELSVSTRIPVVSHRMLETLTSPARRFHAAALAASLQAPRP